jgi:ubiquitin carboxyl-terminal hydrolase 8
VKNREIKNDENRKSIYRIYNHLSIISKMSSQNIPSTNEQPPSSSSNDSKMEEEEEVQEVKEEKKTPSMDDMNMNNPRFFLIRGLNGIRNIGNTCYLNSIIQSMCNILPLTRYLLERKEFESDLRRNAKKRELQFGIQWYHIVNHMWNERKILEPFQFKRVFGELDSRVSGFMQQDAHEIMLSFINLLHDSITVSVEMKISGNIKSSRDEILYRSYESWRTMWSNEYSKIVELFGGQIYSSLRCPDCNYFSDKFESFYTISVPITEKTNTLYDCIHHFQETEILDEENRWKCDGCQNRVQARKKTELLRLPPFFIIHFKRFNDRMQKIAKLIDFQPEIDMSDYITIPNPRTRYTLISTIHHLGGYSGGHYYSNIRKTNGKWLNYDDHRVRLMANFEEIDKRSAYMLIYQRN